MEEIKKESIEDKPAEEVVKTQSLVYRAHPAHLVHHKSSEVSIDYKSIKNKGEKFFKKNRNQWIIAGVLLLLIILLSGSIRLSNLPILKNQVTGEYIPAALDPFYFLRIAETMEKGPLPTFDPMRKPFDVPWLNEILPKAVVFLHKIFDVFGAYTLQYVDVVSPVIFFIIGTAIFFLFIQKITKSKVVALISSALLAFAPAYLYRTTAGFSDHDSIGMMAFFLTMLLFTLAMDRLHKEKVTIKTDITWGIITAASTALAIASWGGAAKFLFMTIPFAMILLWLNESKKEDKQIQKNNLFKYLIFYTSWIILIPIITSIFGYSPTEIVRGYMTSASTIIAPFLLMFMIIDYNLFKRENLLKGKIKEYRVFISGFIAAIIGAIAFSIVVGDLFGFISRFTGTLLQPFGAGRVGITVAENRQPFLIEWMNELRPRVFWIACLGMVFIGINLFKNIKSKKFKWGLILSWILFFSGILFSRISSSSVLNGANFLSKAFYFICFIIFAIVLIWGYIKGHLKLDLRTTILFAWLVPMLISARGAIRLFFVIAPFFVFSASYALQNFYQFAKKCKGELAKVFFIGGTILMVVLLIVSFTSSYKIISAQAKATGPSAGPQWQKAMDWVRTNTLEDSTFVHWWDYGYWVQYLGGRPTIADGGHFQGEFRDHMIGRYLLTTPYPETALSFMKTNNVSYLLIDPTDIGKYGAYSSIGSDVGGNDRNSYIPTMVLDPKQTQETSNQTTRVYQGGSVLDKDILYNDSGNQIFLPEGKAGIGGIILESENDNTTVKFAQPQAVFIHNGQQIRIPLRYLEVEGQFYDFGNGLNSAAKIIPLVTQNSQGGVQADRMGALMYLSEKVSGSLFARLYLLNDPLEQYPTIKLAHAEPDPAIASLNAQGANFGEFIYFNGIRGPIKIWRTDYPENILEKEEFLRTTGEFAEFDNLTFTK